nr:effector binding domain-containing protein [uncultured Caproiciproducens sp.]
MDYEIVELEKKTVAGLYDRTSNSDSDMPLKIGGLWQSFYGGVIQKIPNKAGETAIGLYTNYENGVQGAYDVMVCCEVTGAGELPENVKISAIPAGKYAKFIFHGDTHNGMAAFWREIWNTDLSRKFSCDFEEYLPSDDYTNAQVNIYIALHDFCQSCGMPMTQEEQYGTEKDGSKNKDYCCYCYQNGAFTADCTMEQMIDFCLDYEKDSGMYEDRNQARAAMLEWFPTLKRWHKKY